jgi:hypothetical protein
MSSSAYWTVRFFISNMFLKFVLGSIINAGKRFLKLLKVRNSKGKGRVKLKLSLCLAKHHAMKAYWGSGGIAPRIL